MNMKVMPIGTGTGGCKIAQDLFTRCQGSDCEVQPGFIDMNANTIDPLIQQGVPEERTVILGDGWGSGCNPELASEQFDGSVREIEAMMRDADVVIPIATGGKGTGTGTIVKLSKLARDMGKLTFSVFAEPAQGHEIDGVQLDKALGAVNKLKETTRVVHLLNSKVYVQGGANGQGGHESLNEPVAQTLANIIRMLGEGKQIDVRDLAFILGGVGELYLGHVPISNNEPTEEQIRQLVTECLGNDYIVFKHQVGPAAIAVRPFTRWPQSIKGAIPLHIGKIIAERERAAHEELKKHAKQGQEIPDYDPSRYRQILGSYPASTGCGITVMLSQHDPNHKPLELQLQPRTRIRRSEVQPLASPAPPQGGIPLLPPSGGEAVPFSTPQGAPTAPSPLPATDQPADIPPATVHRTSIRFVEFFDGINHGKEAVLELAAGDTDWNSVSRPENGVKQWIKDERFKRAVPKMSHSWRSELLRMYLSGLPRMRDGETRLGFMGPKKPLSSLSYEELHSLKPSHIADNDRQELLTQLKLIDPIWGEEGCRAFQQHIAGSPESAGEVPASATPQAATA